MVTIVLPAACCSLLDKSSWVVLLDHQDTTENVCFGGTTLIVYIYIYMFCLLLTTYRQLCMTAFFNVCTGIPGCEYHI